MATDAELRAARQPENPIPPAWTQQPATPRQVGYIKGLIETRQIPQSWLLRIKELTEAGLKKGDAGKIIAALKPLPLEPGQDDRSKNNPTIMDVPPGRYAVQTGQDDNDISYFRIKELRKGGHRIVLRIAGPQEIMITGSRANDAIKKIVRFGIGNAAALYGHTIGRCSQCNTRITNRISRELGIGPICGGRVYEDWGERVASARSALRGRGLDPDENVE